MTTSAEPGPDGRIPWPGTARCVGYPTGRCFACDQTCYLTQKLIVGSTLRRFCSHRCREAVGRVARDLGLRVAPYR